MSIRIPKERNISQKRENKPITADILKKKDKKYFWLQLLLPLGLWLIDLCLIFWLFTWYH